VAAAPPRRPWWKRKRWWAVAAAWLVIAYPLGLGPVCYFTVVGRLPESVYSALCSPVWTAAHGAGVGPAFERYLSWWGRRAASD